MTLVTHLPPAFWDYSQHTPYSSYQQPPRSSPHVTYLDTAFYLPNLAPFPMLPHNFQISPLYFLGFLVCHQQTLLCSRLFSEHLLCLLLLTETWLSHSNGRYLFFHLLFVSGLVGRIVVFLFPIHPAKPSILLWTLKTPSPLSSCLQTLPPNISPKSSSRISLPSFFGYFIMRFTVFVYSYNQLNYVDGPLSTFVS